MKKSFSYYTCFNIYYYLIRIKCEDYYINSNVAIIIKAYVYISWL